MGVRLSTTAPRSTTARPVHSAPIANERSGKERSWAQKKSSHAIDAAAHALKHSRTRVHNFIEVLEQRIHDHASNIGKKKLRRHAAAAATGKKHTGWWDATAHEELHELTQRCGATSWKARVVTFIHKERVQLVLIVLLLIDVGVIFVELFIDAEYPKCHIIRRDATSCCPTTVNSSSDYHRLLAGGSDSGSGSGDGGSHHAICEEQRGFGYEDSGTTAACDEHRHATVHILHEVLFGISVSVLSIFLIELLVLLVALGSRFFHNPWYLLDSIVVSSSLVLECVLKATSAGELAGALIFARCWRFVRVAHGVYASTHEAEAGELKTHVQNATRELRAEFDELYAHASELEAEVERLRAGISTTMGTDGMDVSTIHEVDLTDQVDLTETSL